jgi:hypothetical protein
VTKRRVLFFASAALAGSSLLLPLWGFRMSAPQYPDESLHLTVTRKAIAGDVHEVTTLQKYIGVRFPQRIPELRWLTPAIAVLASLLALAGLSGEAAWGRLLRLAAAGVCLLFLAGSGVLLQKRLYDVGHVRDRNAPISAVRDFTPPALGPVKVGNFTVWSYPHAGAAALVAAGLLAVAGARARRSAPPVIGARGAAA